MIRILVLLLAVVATFVAAMIVQNILKEVVEDLRLTSDQKDALKETWDAAQTALTTGKSVGMTSPQRDLFENLRVCSPFPIFLIVAFFIIRRQWREQ